MECIHLAARASLSPEHCFLLTEALHRCEYMVVRHPAQRLRHSGKWSDVVIGVAVRVDIHQLKRMEVHRIRAESPGTPKVLRVEDLLRERHPAACRPTVNHARPRLTDGAEFLFERRVELLCQSVAIRTHIG